MAQATRWTTTYRVPNWLLSDTEESVVGTAWHQDATSYLVEMVREVARRRGATWGVCNRIALQGLRHQDGTAYDPRPDVMVLAQPLPSGDMSAIAVEEAGVPLFVAEIASRSTVGNDRGDKRHAYAAIGVPEYVVFDPDGDLLPSALLAWRLEGGMYVPWRLDRRSGAEGGQSAWAKADGWWHSASLELAIEATRPFLGVRDRDGRRILVSSAIQEHAERQEQARAEAERQRMEAEQARVKAEQARVEAEAARLAAEQARAEAEQQRDELAEHLRRLRDHDDA